MLNNVNNISNTENLMDNLDLLLLDVAIEDTDNSVCTQNTIDMTADYIQNTSFNIPISEVSQQAFINGSNNGLLSILASKGLYFLAATIIGVSSYIAINSFNSSNNNNLIPIVSDSDSTQYKREDSSIIPMSEIKSVDISGGINSSMNVEMHPMILKYAKQKENHISQRTNYNSKGSNVSSKPNYKEFDKEFAAVIKDEKAEIIKIYTEEYKLHNYLYNININDKKSNNEAINIAIYEGEPFNIKKTEGLNELTFISKTQSAYTSKEDYEKTQSFDLKLTENINYYIPKESQDNLEEFFEKQENQSLLNPYYISNVEVSNEKYREFLNWVKVYNGFADYDYLKKDSLNQYKYEKSKAFKYTFSSKNKEVIKQYGSNTIDVLPNNKIWKNDFKNAYMEPFSKNYFSHQAYDYYPVVGISYYQALAYLDWLQYIWQQRINEQGINYSIEFDLPTAYEWEIAVNKIWETSKCNNSSYTNHDVNNSLVCNLAIKEIKDKEYRKNTGILIHKRKTSPKIATENPFMTLVNTSIKCTKKSGIYNLTGNVSEWVKADYNTNWNNFYDYKSKQKDEINDKVKELASYFNSKCNNPNGKLVMGANWLDKRVPSPNSNFYSAMLAKAFVDPMEQHSTIGFRYVVRVKLKDEQKQLLKIKTLGRNMPEVDYSSMTDVADAVSDTKKRENWYMEDPENFSFIPMGSFKNSDSNIVSVQAFYAQFYETNNLSWLLFMNYLIDNDRYDDLKICTPMDKDWINKMNKEQYPKFKDSEAFEKPYYFTSISKKVIKKSQINKMTWTTFASEPIVGISYEAVELYAEWLHKIYGSTNKFRIPTETEWEYMAKGGLQGEKYPWKGTDWRNYQDIILANFSYEGRSIGDMPKEGLMPTGHFLPNDYGLHNISGNAAEMVANSKHNGLNYTKGGSYKSSAKNIEIYSKETWDQKPSSTVGFRLIQTFLGKSKTVKQITPPGTVWLKTNLYVDITEVRNFDYMEYIYWTQKFHGKESEKYKSILPDTNVWTSNSMNNAPYTDYYFRHPSYRDYPLVGVSYEQATEYCKWRSDRVNEYIYVNNTKKVTFLVDSFRTNYPKICEYRLPSKEIYDEIINAKFSESALNAAKKSKSQLYNYKNKKTSDSNNVADITAPVYAYRPNILDIYNLKGNVLELTDKKGIARGGSYINTLEELESDKEYIYTKPEAYLGFRCICYVNTSAIKESKINADSKTSINTSSCQPDWQTINKDGYVGFLDSDNNIIVEPKYESIGKFGEYKCELALVNVSGYMGIIDNLGREIVAPKYNSIGKFGVYNEDWAEVSLDGYVGFIDINGEEIVKPKYDYIEKFGDYKKDWAKVSISGYVGFINTKGEEIIKPKYESIDKFGIYNEELALVSEDGNLGFITIQAQEIVKPKYNSIGKFGVYNEDWAEVSLDGYVGFIDINGKEIVKPKYDYIEKFGIYKNDWAKVSISGFVGFINSKGEEIVKPKYESIGKFGVFDEELALVSEDGLLGFISIHSQEIVKPKYDSIGKLGESRKDLFQVTVDGLIGYIDTNGEEVIKPNLDSVE